MAKLSPAIFRKNTEYQHGDIWFDCSADVTVSACPLNVVARPSRGPCVQPSDKPPAGVFDIQRIVDHADDWRSIARPDLFGSSGNGGCALSLAEEIKHRGVKRSPRLIIWMDAASTHGAFVAIAGAAAVVGMPSW